MTERLSFEPEIRRAAEQLMAQYGDDAAVVAVMRAAEHAALGDVDALHHWDRIIECIAAMELGVAEGPTLQ